MRRADLIGACGLTAMVSGIVYVAQGMLAPPPVRLVIPDNGAPLSPALVEGGVPSELAIQGGKTIGDIQTLFSALLALLRSYSYVLGLCVSRPVFTEVPRIRRFSEVRI